MSRNKYPEETVKLILDVSEKLFLKKGYDHTTLQDIIDNLGGLSKGAIYHHFKSKEDILQAVGEKLGQENVRLLSAVRDEKGITGYEKLKKIFLVALESPIQDAIFAMAPNMIENPRFLAMQLEEIFTISAPLYIEPIIEEGVKDGSIITPYPKELAEVILILTNIWLNPLVVTSNMEEMEKKMKFFIWALKSMGLDLFDEQMSIQYKKFTKKMHHTVHQK